MEIGFDNSKYVRLQSKEIKKRIELFDKLYLEIGGKFLDDYHASRVLPGFKPDAKVRILKKLKNDLEIIICINANDIERHKNRGEFNITYDDEVMRLIDNFKNLDFPVNSVVITLYNNQPCVDTFIKKLHVHHIKTYIHTFTKGYPTDIDTIVSDEGYGMNPYIKTSKKLILITAPGPGSGKLATCLSQLYHEHKLGVNAGYAKFETFPVWNLPLKHPVNLAYESATADLKDVNMIDSFHLAQYNETAISYNRDLEMFPVVKNILHKITGKDIYYSPTNMGVNVIGNCIIDDEIVSIASKREIVRRYYKEMVNYKEGLVDIDAPQKIKLLMNELNIDDDLLPAIKIARKKSIEKKTPVIAINMDNKIITGKETKLLSAPSALIINVIKQLSNIPDKINLLSPSILKPILKMRGTQKNIPLNLQEVIIALSICSVTNPSIEQALSHLPELKDKDAHATYIVSNGDLKALKILKIRLTCDAEFHSTNLFQS